MGLNEELNKPPRRQLLNEPSTPGNDIQRGWTTEAMTYMGWKEHTLKYYAEIRPTKNKFGTEILCALQFKTVWEIIQCCLTSKRYKGFGPTDLPILYDAKILRGGEVMRILLYIVSAVSLSTCDPGLMSSSRVAPRFSHDQG